MFTDSCLYAGVVRGVQKNLLTGPDKFHPRWIFQPATQQRAPRGALYTSKVIKKGVVSVDHNHKRQIMWSSHFPDRCENCHLRDRQPWCLWLVEQLWLLLSWHRPRSQRDNLLVGLGQKNIPLLFENGFVCGIVYGFKMDPQEPDTVHVWTMSNINIVILIHTLELPGGLCHPLPVAP